MEVSIASTRVPSNSVSRTVTFSRGQSAAHAAPPRSFSLHAPAAMHTSPATQSAATRTRTAGRSNTGGNFRGGRGAVHARQSGVEAGQQFVRTDARLERG